MLNRFVSVYIPSTNHRVHGDNVRLSARDHRTGELDGPATIALFASLVNSGLAWQLQGFYGRTASALINGGALVKDESGQYVPA